MNYKKCKKLNGIFTVEIVLIFPFIISVIFFVIFVTLLYYNKVITVSSIYKATVKESQNSKNNENNEKDKYAINRKLEKELANTWHTKLIAIDKSEESAHQNVTKITVDYQVKMPMFIHFFSGLIKKEKMTNISGKIVVNCLDGVSSVRKYGK